MTSPGDPVKSQIQTDWDSKPELSHNEIIHLDGSPADTDGPVALIESKFAHLNKKQTLRVFWKTVLYAFAVGLGALFDGFAIVIPGSIVANQGFINTFSTLNNAKGVPILDPKVVGAWGGIQSGGQIFAMWSGPFISDKLGRKANMYTVVVLVLAAIAIELSTKSWKIYAIARLFSGIAVGYVQSGIPVFISEIAPPAIRGSLLSMYSMMYNLGGLSASIALKIVVGLGPDKFRHAFYSQFVFVGLFVCVLPFLPESPWYYARKHEHDKAKKSLVRLNGGIPGWDVDYEYEVLRTNVAHSESLKLLQKQSAFKELFIGTNGRRTLVALLPMLYSYMTGLSLIFGYTSYFFKLAGVKDPFLGSLIVKLVLNAATLISFYTVETVGRRWSLLGGGGAMGLVMLIMGILASTGSATSGEAVVALFCIHIASYALSVGPIAYTFIAEVPTARLRARTAGLVTGAAASFGLIFNYCTPIMLASPGANWGLNIGYFWAGTTALSLVALFFFIPETKGRTYAELDELFERKIPARKFKTTTTKTDEQRVGNEDSV
ncbi:hypothetical protein I302_102715 [Kwoniella bestiolae CBS 10118]|uniref:Major facilitator superfamily (MFS) profile domain-containing protein n=1 Tax=Kwoniella bestiolae CBS 10118 TaxID=1296100 RepID=A0A1B9GG28_9TREE|nr:hypothetical protein I302_01408 [Kwoniella bestiolae CBS 10118]OCF29895.1 hypothetical protein I302_01408 [Kwoniella bestiolae CBS 10118]